MRANPFHIDVPDAVLSRIRSRLWSFGDYPAFPGADAWQAGTSAGYLDEFVGYWRDRYDWRAEEAKLNRWPQYRVALDGVDIHFYHVEAQGGDRDPILLTHGWPGSVVEFQAVIPLLADAGFSVVVPSLPGFGWSGAPAQAIGAEAIARLWRELMVDVLGYRSFFAQGGDFGGLVSERLALHHADVVRAVHLNFHQAPPPAPNADRDLMDHWRSVARFMETEGAYIHQHTTRPQTLGLALHDNPAGLASWVLEKFHSWGDTGGQIETRFTKDQLITNLMSYLVTGNVAPALWVYWAASRETADPEAYSRVPTAIARFPAERYPLAERRLVERNHNVVRWTGMASGGHFAAMEEPQAFAGDVIEFFSGF